MALAVGQQPGRTDAFAQGRLVARRVDERGHLAGLHLDRGGAGEHPFAFGRDRISLEAVSVRQVMVHRGFLRSDVAGFFEELHGAPRVAARQGDLGQPDARVDRTRVEFESAGVVFARLVDALFQEMAESEIQLQRRVVRVQLRGALELLERRRLVGGAQHDPREVRPPPFVGIQGRCGPVALQRAVEETMDVVDDTQPAPRVGGVESLPHFTVGVGDACGDLRFVDVPGDRGRRDAGFRTARDAPHDQDRDGQACRHASFPSPRTSSWYRSTLRASKFSIVPSGQVTRIRSTSSSAPSPNNRRGSCDER